MAISVYLFVFRVLFLLFKLCPQKKKTVGVASFGDNIFYATRAIHTQSSQEIIILKDPSCRFKFDASIGTILSFSIKHPFSFLKSIYHLATATTVLVDTYYGFLAVCHFRPGTKCIQLWHAAGALKQFGLLDPTIPTRSKKANNRFQAVYDRFDYTVVGSDKMAEVFKQSFGLTDDRILKTGVPRTDFFFDHDRHEQIYEKMKNKFPIIKEKKVLLYAPTYRNNQLSRFQLELDLKKLYEAFSDEYVLFIKLHPAVSCSLTDDYKGFVYDVSRNKINELLLVTDTLISDYSSISFEFSLLEKPMIFYAYDLEKYKQESGLIQHFEETMPGPVVFTTDELIEVIQFHSFDRNQVKHFAAEWNTFSIGNSSMALARFVTNTEETTEERGKIHV
ncbi:CDP-glycerol glycerophosphotransferase family protein [Oceanobacillus senegalensis]|uniref:CDP-glycerol glycerophosphotransferase family protein n=1 Tax=Oceanobacillus senegalensis TaxID=1936063 RepID=UPI001FEAB61D|nr:CDP-glycerol glycerophosphotransferase family protein [Oceanobacillus senegalensis]